MMEPQVLSWSNTQITIMLPSDLGPGTYELRVQTKDGVSPAVNFSVKGDIPMDDKAALDAAQAGEVSALGGLKTALDGVVVKVVALIRSLVDHPSSNGLGAQIAMSKSIETQLRAVTDALAAVPDETGDVVAPVLSQISPATATVGSTDLTVSVTGDNFTATPPSVVNVNGSPRPTTYVSATELSAVLPASDFLAAGDLSITVSNVAGASDPVILTVS